MAGVLQGARVFSIDGGDAIVELDCLCAQSLLRFGRFGPVEPRIVFCEQGNVIVAKCRDEWRHTRVFAHAVGKYRRKCAEVQQQRGNDGGSDLDNHYVFQRVVAVGTVAGVDRGRYGSDNGRRFLAR